MFEVYNSYGTRCNLLVYLCCSLVDIYDIDQSLVDEMYEDSGVDAIC